MESNIDDGNLMLTPLNFNPYRQINPKKLLPQVIGSKKLSLESYSVLYKLLVSGETTTRRWVNKFLKKMCRIRETGEFPYFSFLEIMPNKGIS